MALRIVSAFVVASVSMAAAGQEPPTTSPVEQQRGNQPTLSTDPSARDQRLPPPSDASSYTLRIKSFREYRLAEGKIVATEAHFEYRGYDVRAKEVHGDLETNVFQLRGEVDVVGQSETVKAEYMEIDFQNRTFKLQSGTADVKPQRLEGFITTDIYLRAESATGREGLLEARIAAATTCSYDRPHYEIETQELIVIPDRRLTFKNMRLRVLGRTVFGLPRLDIPLDRSTREYLPEVGQSIDDGYYLRFKFPLAIRQNLFIFRTDLTTKKGVALGGDYLYATPESKGEVRAIAGFEDGFNTIRYSASAKHRQRFSFGEFDGNVESRSFRFFGGPTSKLTDIRLAFLPNFLGTNGTSRLGLNHLINETGDFRSTQSNFSLSDYRRWDSRHTTSLNLNLSEVRASVGGTTISTRKVLDVRFQDSLAMPRFSAQLDFNRAIPIGTNLSFLGGIDRAPELSFRTDKTRLLGPQANFPNFSALLSVGNFIDNAQSLQVARLFFDLRTTKTGVPINGFGVEYDAGLKQGLYGDNTAQFTPSANIRTTYQHERAFSINLRYNYTRQHGFTPLFFDRGGRSNVVSFDALAHPAQGLKIGGQTGYDINREREGQIAWQSPAIRLEYEPTDRFRFRALANYNAFAQRWGSVRLDTMYRQGDFTFAASANYDAGSGRWGSVNLFADALRWGRLSASVLLQWNGFTRQFDSRQFSFAYDMHCTEAILQILEDNTGFSPGRQIAFFIRIKGLPFDSAFGTGRLGQPVGGGTGPSY